MIFNQYFTLLKNQYIPLKMKNVLNRQFHRKKCKGNNENYLFTFFLFYNLQFKTIVLCFEDRDNLPHNFQNFL